MELFEPDEMKRWLEGQPFPEAVADSIDWRQSRSALAFDVAVALGNRGFIDAALIRRIAHVRPGRAEWIDEIATSAGFQPIDYTLSARSSARRIKYRRPTINQLAVFAIYTAVLSRAARVGLAAAAIVSLVSIVIGAATAGVVGAVTAVCVLIAASISALCGLCVVTFMNARAMELRVRSLESDWITLIAAVDGFEIRSLTGAALTPYHLLGVTRRPWWYEVEFGGFAIDVFPHANLSEGDAEEFWWHVMSRTARRE